jgi:hypothetical protein
MSEASLDLIRRGPQLSELFQSLTPLTDQYRLLTDSKDIWLVPPYPHEQRVVSAYLALKEKREAHQLSDTDSYHVEKLLTWISELAEQPNMQDYHTGINTNRKPHPLLSIRWLSIIKNQITSLTEESDNTGEKAFFILRQHIDELKQQSITSPDF